MAGLRSGLAKRLNPNDEQFWPGRRASAKRIVYRRQSVEETWTEPDIAKYDGMLKYPEIFYLPEGWAVFFTTIYADYGFLAKSRQDKSPRIFKSLDDASKFLYGHGFKTVIVTLEQYPREEAVRKSKHRSPA